MARHRITISITGGRLDFDLETDGAPAGKAKKIHAKNNDRVEWTCNDGNFAGVFKGNSPLNENGFYADSGSDTQSLRVTAAHNAVDDEKNHYPYFVAVVKDDTVIMQDPEIIIDA